MFAGSLIGGLDLLVACAPTLTINALVPSDTHTLTAGVAYGRGAVPPARHLPAGQQRAAAGPAGRAVLLSFYGGSWNTGERADYRLYPEVAYPDFLHDCAQALVYALREAGRFGGDPWQVFVMGHSAGAYNAAMLALDPRWLAAQGHELRQLAGWIGLAGPYDFVPIVNPEVRPVFHHPNVPPDSRAIRGFLGAALQDTLVDPQRNTAQLARHLQAAGTDVSVRWYEWVNHFTLAGALAHPLRFLAPVLDDDEAFIKHTPAS